MTGMAMVAEGGVTVMDRSVAAVTVIEACAESPPTLAVIVVVPALVLSPVATTSPGPPMFATLGFDEDQLTPLVIGTVVLSE
jgi:hypothetical protein